jgi:hypothetical protein
MKERQNSHTAQKQNLHESLLTVTQILFSNARLMSMADAKALMTEAGFRYILKHVKSIVIETQPMTPSVSFHCHKQTSKRDHAHNEISSIHLVYFFTNVCLAILLWTFSKKI